MEQTKKKKFQMPSAYTVLFIIIAVIAVLTWFIPAGHYSVDDAGNIVAGSYERVQQNPQGLWDIFMAPINGMLGVPAGELTKETTEAIPASSAPVLLIIPKNPPTTKMKKEIGIAAGVSLVSSPAGTPNIPLIGAMKISHSP